MTDPSDRLDHMLAEKGLMNFHLECSSDGRPARITMDDENVYVATTAGAGEVQAIAFADAQVEGSGSTRSVRSKRGDSAVKLDFAAGADLDRFLRVLRVRQEGTLVRVQAQEKTARRPAPAAAHGHLSSATGPRPAELPNLYRIWADWALLASTFLLIVAWIDLAVGAILTLARWLNGDGQAGLIWLMFALVGFAMPFCLAALTRMVAYRYRMQDSSGSLA